MKLDDAVTLIQRARETPLPGADRVTAADLNAALDALLELARATLAQRAAADTTAPEAAGDPDAAGAEPVQAAPASEAAGDESEAADTEAEPAAKAPIRDRRAGEYCRDCRSCREIALTSRPRGEPLKIETSPSVRCERDGQRHDWSDWCEWFAWPDPRTSHRAGSAHVEIR